MTTALVALTLLAAPDIGVDSIIQPRGMMANAGQMIRPQALIANHGDSAASFMAWMKVIGQESLVYTESLDVAELGAMSDTVVWFPDLDPALVPFHEEHVVRCSVHCSADTWPVNDTMSRTFELYPRM